jgi:cytochrome c-type biogenesis protein CcmH
VFWTIAAAVLFAAALITFLPLLRARSLWKPFALALVFILPATAAWMYTQIGTPEAISLEPPPRTAQTSDTHSSESQEMDSMIAGLRGRLTESPEDLDGWMMLARTLKATERYEEAVEALETANRIAPDNPYVAVDLIEARIFTTPNGRFSEEMILELQNILDQNPGMQKALWLMGIAASQAGDYPAAIDYWETLLAQLEPGNPVADSVQSQIDDARGRMGDAVEAAPEVAAEPAPAAPADDGEWSGTRVTVKGDAASLPAGGVLYVMIRSPGPAMGPPLGVRRIIDPALPLDLTISDKDSMMQERLISTESEVQLQARISLTGSPAASSGDWQSTPLTVALNSGETVELIIDQRVE